MEFPTQKWMSWSVFKKKFPKQKKLSYGFFGDTYRYNDIVFKVFYSCKRSREEIEILKTVSESTTPFLSKLRAHYYCKDASFSGYRNKGVFKCWNDWEKVKTGNGIILAMDYSGKPLSEHLDERSLSKKMLFMLFYALYKFNCITQMHHNDPYETNYTIQKISKQDITLTVSNKTYVLKNIEYIPVLLDYGKSSVTKTFDTETDISILMDSVLSYTDLKWVANMDRYETASEMIAHHFSSYQR